MKKYSDGRLFTNVLGNKLGVLTKLSQHYTTVVEPYGGSAAISLNMPNVKHIYIGETDNILRTAYQLWLTGELKDAQDTMRETDFACEGLCDAAHLVLNDPSNIAYDPETVYKAFLFRQSVFCGVMRLNRAGKINVNIATDKLKRAKARTLPTRPTATMEVYRSAHNAMHKHQRDANTLIVLDPPYYNPGSTPCYPGHNPKDREETEQAIMYLQQGLAAGVDVLFSAYLDDDMLQFVNEVVAQSTNLSYTVETISTNSLTNLARATKKGDPSKQDKPQEYVLYFQKLDFDSIC